MSRQDTDNSERPSKTQQKRRMQALFELGRKLVELDQAQLRKLPLSEELYSGVIAAQSMQRGARKRQIKWIAGKLREAADDSLIAALAELETNKAEIAAAFHRIERWRERLLQEGDAALAEFIETYPHADAGRIRRLVRNAANEVRNNKPPKSTRALFREIRETLERER